MKGRIPSSKASTSVLKMALCVASFACSGCHSERDGLEPEASGPGACAGTCHGDGDNPAPPNDLDGRTETWSPGVGAHQAHLNASAFHAGMACANCHVVPEKTGAPGHADDARPAEVLFSGLAVKGGRVPSYDPRTRTCADTYCHSGPTTAMSQWPGDAVWIYPQDSAAACGTSCHGSPPGGSHPTSDACELCHAETAGPGLTIAVQHKHIDGVLQVSAQGCAGCHGSEDSAAPPVDLAGNTDTASPGVGAHRRHLQAAEMTLAEPFACTVCHEVPPDSPTHMDGTTDLSFTGLATGTVSDALVSHQSVPSYSSATRQCSNVYCHGGWTEVSNPSGGSATEPVWNRVDGTQVSCSGCHGLPPPAPHPDSAGCDNCHPAVVDEQLNIVDLSKHVNGQVDFN